MTKRTRIFWVGLSVLLLLGLGLSGQTVETTETVERADSILMLLTKGGVVMIPLALCSFLAVSIALERFFSLSHKTMIPPDLEKDLYEILESGNDKRIQQAFDKCDEHPGALSQMFRAGLDHWEHETNEAEKAMADAASLQMRKIRRSIRSLRLIGNVSPLLGLLGTVMGMIRAFQTVALSSQSINKAELLAEGIYQAMVTTATGLIIAIPTLIVFFYFNNRIEKISEEYENMGNAFILRFFRNRFKLEG